MIAKAHIRGLWEAGSCFCFSFFTPYVSLSFHPLVFTRSAYRRGRCAASHACTASQCDLRDPGWGNSDFQYCDFFALAPCDPSLWCFVCSLLFPWMACSVCGTQAAIFSLPFTAVRSWCLQHSTDGFLFGVFGFVAVCFCFCLCLAFAGLCCWGFGWLFLWTISGPTRDITVTFLSLFAHEAFTSVPASLAWITTTSKKLYNDLAEAIEALQQKKDNSCSFWAENSGRSLEGQGEPISVKKRRAQICLQIQRFIKFLQNYAGGRVRQPRTPNTSAARVVTN